MLVINNSLKREPCWYSTPGTSMDPILIFQIRAGERFCAYIVIPMFPEGDPTSAPMQEILYWQSNTMEVLCSKSTAKIQKPF